MTHVDPCPRAHPWCTADIASGVQLALVTQGVASCPKDISNYKCSCSWHIEESLFLQIFQSFMYFKTSS